MGSAAVAGGVAGAKHSVATGLRGTFTWAEWGREAEMGKTMMILDHLMSGLGYYEYCKEIKYHDPRSMLDPISSYIWLFGLVYVQYP